MFSVCSATTSCSSSLQISLHGRLTPYSSYLKTFKFRCILEDPSPALDFSRRTCFHDIHPFKSYSVNQVGKVQAVAMRSPEFVEISDVEEELVEYTGQLTENADSFPMPITTETDVQTIFNTDTLPMSSPTETDVQTIFSTDSSKEGVDYISTLKIKLEDILNKGENAVEDSFDRITSSIKSAIEGANQAVDGAVSKVTNAIDQTGDIVNDKLTGISAKSEEISGKVGTVAVDLLRRTIVTLEDSLAKGGTFIVSAYGSLKDLLPQEIHSLLNSTEENATKILGPVGATFQQVNISLQGLERYVGLDPNDPLVPFSIFLGASATLWSSYLVLTYGGYAGDLSPTSTFALLTGKENALLIDVRPEELRERDGVPDLRRSARFRYANVTLPAIDGSVIKLLRSGNELNDTLIANIIRNLKIVDGRSKVIVMDADGSRSKSIARSLRKLGVKRPYLVKGGFQSCVNEGIRVKKLKPETALTILNEEAAAILEEVKPTPLKVIGFGVGLVAAVYALSDWEKCLQYIGVFGIVQTVYLRIASYESAQDFNKDVRLLLVPVKLGGQAISWASAKFETKRNGLPTLPPSSSDIQSRVLQAAAKHESQPSDSTELLQDSSSDPLSDNVDLSKA